MTEEQAKILEAFKNYLEGIGWLRKDYPEIQENPGDDRIIYNEYIIMLLGEWEKHAKEV